MLPILFLSSPDKEEISLSKTVTKPLSNESCPVRILMSVVLPAPDGPRSPNISPSPISKFIPDRTVFPEKPLYISLQRIIPDLLYKS
jgi:hypothetical protein